MSSALQRFKKSDVQFKPMSSNVAVQTEDVQAENVQSHDVQTHDVQTEDVHTEYVQTEDAQTEDVQTENVQTHDVQTHDVQTEDAQTQDVTVVSRPCVHMSPEIDTGSQTKNMVTIETPPPRITYQTPAEWKFWKERNTAPLATCICCKNKCRPKTTISSYLWDKESKWRKERNTAPLATCTSCKSKY